MITSLTDIPAIRDYLTRIGAEPRSLRTAVVRETRGDYWQDVAIIRFDKTNGEVTSTHPDYEPTDLEAMDIQTGILGVQWPEHQRLTALQGDLPWKDAKPEDVFIFRDLEKRIVMVQVRREKKGEKSYIPYTYWTDGRWRVAEPDGALPLYNLERIAKQSTVFIHEGAKAARHCQWMVDGESRAAREALKAHPWGEELSNAVHLGWIGGALSPRRTDWSALAKHGIRRVYIVPDNDDPGRRAVPAISQAVNLPCFAVEFTDLWPPSFDLADPFPDKMFAGDGDTRYYRGPTFRSCLSPVTWATDLVPNPSGQGRPIATLRESFIGSWSYIEDSDFFVCNEMPDIVRAGDILNRMMGPFSHSANTAKLICDFYNGRTVYVCYRPDAGEHVIDNGERRSINMHIPGPIKARPGNPKPWLEFLDYLFVNEEERHQMARWIATLIARPDIRMEYSILLISEKQGVGKTTLGAHVLAPIIGQWNVGYPGEMDLVSQFNDWVVGKRLVVASEIYSGHSWKAYHTLKAAITDEFITVNQKYQRPYRIQNWAHIIASSNSRRALKMENDDRRWFYPELTETPWPREKFAAFRAWLETGGLGIIVNWAEGFGDYVQRGERAPMTEQKEEMILGSRSDAQREAVALAEAAEDYGEPIALAMKDVVTHVRGASQGIVYDTDYELKKAMIESGMVALPRRLKLFGRMDYVVMNKQAWGAIQDQTGHYQDLKERAGEENALARAFARKPSDLLETAF